MNSNGDDQSDVSHPYLVLSSCGGQKFVGIFGSVFRADGEQAPPIISSADIHHFDVAAYELVFDEALVKVCLSHHGLTFYPNSPIFNEVYGWGSYTRTPISLDGIGEHIERVWVNSMPVKSLDMPSVLHVHFSGREHGFGFSVGWNEYMAPESIQLHVGQVALPDANHVLFDCST